MVCANYTHTEKNKENRERERETGARHTPNKIHFTRHLASHSVHPHHHICAPSYYNTPPVFVCLFSPPRAVEDWSGAGFRTQQPLNAGQPTVSQVVSAPHSQGCQRPTQKKIEEATPHKAKPHNNDAPLPFVGRGEEGNEGRVWLWVVVGGGAVCGGILVCMRHIITERVCCGAALRIIRFFPIPRSSLSLLPLPPCSVVCVCVVFGVVWRGVGAGVANRQARGNIRLSRGQGALCSSYNISFDPLRGCAVVVVCVCVVFGVARHR